MHDLEHESPTVVDTPRPMAPARIPPEVTELAEQLLEAQRQILGDRLLGLYLFGSATTGSFQAGISDMNKTVPLS
jgi:hypothetical protein